MASGTLEPQVIQVVLPDGDKEVRLVSLDSAAGSLILRQANLDDGGQVQVGGQAVVKLSSIGHAATSGKTVFLRAGGHSGPVLLELHFDSASVAQSWGRAIGTNEAASPGSSPARSATRSSPSGSAGRGSPAGRGSATAAGGGRGSPQGRGRGQANSAAAAAAAAEAAATEEANGEATKTLRELVRQQEEQVRLLEEITKRKDEQLSKMQERLEDALTMLQLGQETYGKQQAHLDQRTKIIGDLKGQIEGADAVAAACGANAANAASGLAAARAARAAASSPNGRGASPKAASPQGGAGRAAAKAAAEAGLPAGLFAALASKAAAQQRPGPGPAAGAEDSDDDEEGLAEQQALLEKLRAIEAEKGEFEAQLRGEQGSIFAELQELQKMMADLGVEINTVEGSDEP